MANKSSPSPESIQTQSLIINLPQIFKLVGITHTHTHTQEHKWTQFTNAFLKRYLNLNLQLQMYFSN
jgi:hypothetical protein